MKKLLLSVFAVFMIAGAANAQVAVRGNLAYLPFGTLNVGAEMALAKKWTLGADLLGSIVSPYNFYEAKGLMLSVEGRYYFCEAFNKHHIGVYAMGGWYDTVSINNETISRVMFGCENAPHLPDDVRNVVPFFAGISYGYYLKLAHGWGLDFSVGGGVSIARYKSQNSSRRPWTNLHYGLSKISIDLSYKF